MAHSVDIKPFVSSGEYLAKMDDSRHWGADRELAKKLNKTGQKKSGIHPFGLLEIAAQFREGDGGIAAKLFREYVTEMTGKRQIFWTHGLKKRAGIDEKTDEELSEEQREKAVLLGDIPRDDWQLVREAGLQAHILELAEDKGWGAIQELLDRLVALEIARLEAAIKALDGHLRSHTLTCVAQLVARRSRRAQPSPLRNLPEGQTVCGNGLPQTEAHAGPIVIAANRPKRAF